jgi:CBS domain-containing protein
MKASPSCLASDTPIADSVAGPTATSPATRWIADIMTANPVTTEADASLHEAARLLLRHRVGSLPVVHRGLLVGIITPADLVERLIPRKHTRWWMLFTDPERLARECQRARGTTVGEVMTHPVIALPPDATVEAAVHLMRDHRIGRVPVADHGHLVGIVSHSDLLRVLAGAPPGSEPSHRAPDPAVDGRDEARGGEGGSAAEGSQSAARVGS